jgi:PadR family transcriptional regulator AphA
MGHEKHSGYGFYPLECVALGLLMNGPRHAYKLYQDFAGEFNLIWSAGQAKFYVALADLEKKGYVNSTAQPQEGRPNRKVYHLTGSGRALFLDWLHQPVPSMRAIRVELIAKLRLFDLLNLPGADQLVDRQIDILNAMLAEWGERAGDSTPFPGLIHDFRTRQAHFVIDWLHNWKERLSQTASVS